jgi:hypothetical protein
MYGAEIFIREERYKNILCGLLQYFDCVRLKPISFKPSLALGNLANKSLEGPFTDKEVGGLLVAANLSQSHRSYAGNISISLLTTSGTYTWLIPVRFLCSASTSG